MNFETSSAFGKVANDAFKRTSGACLGGLVGLDELLQPRGLIFVGKNGEPGRDHCPGIERTDLCHFIFLWLRLVSSPSPMVLASLRLETGEG